MSTAEVDPILKVFSQKLWRLILAFIYFSFTIFLLLILICIVFPPLYNSSLSSWFIFSGHQSHTNQRTVLKNIRVVVIMIFVLIWNQIWQFSKIPLNVNMWRLCLFMNTFIFMDFDNVTSLYHVDHIWMKQEVCQVSHLLIANWKAHLWQVIWHTYKGEVWQLCSVFSEKRQ